MAQDRREPDDDSAVLGADVVHDRGGWWVRLTVGFRDEVVTRDIGPYLTRREADVAARIIPRAAGRHGPPPEGY